MPDRIPFVFGRPNLAPVITYRRIGAMGALLVVLLLAACGGDEESDATLGPPQAMTIDDLDAAVRPAARALLDAAGLEATSIYFGFDDPEEVVRYDWFDYRANGDNTFVINRLDEATAVVRVGNMSYTAASGKEAAPWSLGEATADVLPPRDTVEQLAQGSILAMPADSPTLFTVTRREAEDGSNVWRFAGIADDGVTEVALFEWIIDRDGVLWFSRIESDQMPLLGSTRAMVTRYAIPDRDEPIQPPTLGAPLDLESLGVPEELRDLDEPRDLDQPRDLDEPRDFDEPRDLDQ